MSISAGEKLSGMIVSDATGEDTDAVLKAMADTENGTPKQKREALAGAVGLDPASLAIILDLVLGFIMSLIDKLREGGMCVREGVIVGEDGEEVTVIQALSEKEKADRVVDTLQNPRRRTRARVYVDLRDHLRGTGGDPWDHTVSTFKVAGNTDNEQLVRDAIHEGEEPDYGWT